MSPRVVVVGGGIAGLTAAFELRTLLGDGADITLSDPAPSLGGVLQTATLAGQPVDLGAEAYVARRPEVPALLDRLGLGDRSVVTTGVRPLVWAAGRLHPLPTATVVGIPSAPGPLGDLVDAATLARMADEPHRPMSWTPGADPAVGAVVADRFGDQVVTRSVDPMLAGVYAGSAHTIGIRSAAPGVAAALDRGARSLTAAVTAALPPASGAPVFNAVGGGYRVLVDALEARAAIRREREPVTALRRDGRGWAVHCGRTRLTVDAVVLAVGVTAVAGLLADVAPDAAAAAQRVPVASSAVLAMTVDPELPLPEQSGVLVAGGETLHAKAITLSSRKWGRRGDVEVIRMSFGRFGDDLARTTPEETLRDWAADDLATVLGFAVVPRETVVRRWIDAMPQYGPGHPDLAAALRAALPAGLTVAGNYLDGVGVPACVATGLAAARAVAHTPDGRMT